MDDLNTAPDGTDAASSDQGAGTRVPVKIKHTNVYDEPTDTIEFVASDDTEAAAASSDVEYKYVPVRRTADEEEPGDLLAEPDFSETEGPGHYTQVIWNDTTI